VTQKLKSVIIKPAALGMARLVAFICQTTVLNCAGTPCFATGMKTNDVTHESDRALFAEMRPQRQVRNAANIRPYEAKNLPNESLLVKTNINSSRLGCYIQ
jgi:hypothetical protein